MPISVCAANLALVALTNQSAGSGQTFASSRKIKTEMRLTLRRPKVTAACVASSCRAGSAADERRTLQETRRMHEQASLRASLRRISSQAERQPAKIGGRVAANKCQKEGQRRQPALLLLIGLVHCATLIGCGAQRLATSNSSGAQQRSKGECPSIQANISWGQSR